MNKKKKNFALITGASSGIGEAFARKLASQGYNLIIVARRKKRLQLLAAELQEKHSIHIEVFPADLTKEQDLTKIEKKIAEFTNISMLVNNAGFGTRGSFAEVDITKSVNMIKVHIIASTRLTKAVLPQMINQNKGVIINLGTLAVGLPNPGVTVYTATKSYLTNFSESLQAEMNGKNLDIKIQILCPGLTQTDFFNTEEYGYQTLDDEDEFDVQSADEVVEESLASLTKEAVVVVPGSKNREILSLMSNEGKSWDEAATIVFAQDSKKNKSE
ncbi:MAG: SDR family oxidoreductase [Candidatus Heimdallarchaeota archaeon]